MSILLPNLSVIIVMYFMSKLIHLRQKPYDFIKPKNSVLLSIAVVAIDMYLVNPIILILLSRYFPGVQGLWRVVLELIFPITLLAPIWLILWLRKEPLSTLGLTRLNLAKSAVIGLVLSLVFLGVQITVSHSSMSFGLNKLWWLLYSGIVGLTEEILFRGYLQSRLIASIGKPKGLIVSSLLFCIAHLPQRMLTYGLGVVAAGEYSLVILLPALTLGYTMMKTENIIAPIILHTFIDWSQNLLGKS